LAVILSFPVSSLRNHGDWIQLYSYLSATPTVIFSFFFFPSLAIYQDFKSPAKPLSFCPPQQLSPAIDGDSFS
jgi:hypothetical protein